VRIGKTGYRALDEIVEQANLQKRCDRPFGALLYGRVQGRPISEHTFRRLPIPYKKVGRSASYLVDDIIAAAEKEIADAVPFTPKERPARPRRRPTVTCVPVNADEPDLKRTVRARAPPTIAARRLEPLRKSEPAAQKEPA
jgi:hypothetical protein